MGGTFQSAIDSIVKVAVAIYFPIELAACAVLVPIYVRVIKKVLHLDAPKQAEAEITAVEEKQ